MTDHAWRQMVDAPLAAKNEVEAMERRILAATDPAEKQRLIRELVELTKKETRG